MRETGSTSSPSGREDVHRFGEADSDDYQGEEPGFDWVVFILRAASFVTFGATLVTAVDLSLNQDIEWQTVMRLSILPFAAGMLVLAAGELVDRTGD